MHTIFGVAGLVLGAALTALCVGLGAVLLGRRKDVYLYGVGAMAAAFVAGSLGFLTADWLFSLPPQAWLIVAGPAIEEAARLWTILTVSAALQQRRDWLLFGLVFALFETAMKIMRPIAMISHGGLSDDLVVSAFAAPLAPLVLHVMLSVIAIALFRRGWRPAGVFALCWGIHALHNRSAVAQWLGREGEPGFVLGVLLYCGVYLAVIALVLLMSRGLRRVTSAPAHANSLP